MELETLIERTQQIRESMPLPYVKQRMAAAAAELSRAGDNQARVELLNEAVLAVTKALYDTDPDGTPCNIDRVTYRILIPVPWGRAGWKKWSLRYWESEQLRRILRVRCQMRRVVPLFDYSEERRSWHLNLDHYSRLDLALIHWKANSITLRDWRLYADVYRENARRRMGRYRDETNDTDCE